MQNNIILVGFMGGGKSLVSKNLAKKMDLKRISTDEIIEQKEKKPIAHIFAESGEQYFRNLEKDVVKELSGQKGLIIDCGGGVFLDPENITRLNECGTTFNLFTSPEVIYRRVKDNTTRPLLNVPEPLIEINRLIKERKKFYEQAHFTINTDSHTVEDTAEEIIKRLS